MAPRDVPTAAQASMLRYFAGLQVTVNLKGAAWTVSERACLRRGWIEPTGAVPPYRTTGVGFAALTRYDEAHTACEPNQPA